MARKDGVGLVLGGLHVRLVEGVDPKQRAGDRRRDPPAKNPLAELVWVGEPPLEPLTAAPDRHDPPALFPRRLRHELLDPEAEVAFGLEKRRLGEAQAELK